jgi:dTDP-4-dehydrorhamnose 3,5-epimerase
MLRRIEEMQGLKLFEAKWYPDERGYLLQAYMVSDLEGRGISGSFLQAIQSRSRRGVVRGLHFQWNPPMGKLVRCLRGRIFDVAIDLRRGSPTFGDHCTAELTEENRRMFWLPAGFAHGFMALEDDSVVLYHCTAEWAPLGEAGIRWNDPDIGIEWPPREAELSPKDRVAMSLTEWLARPESASFTIAAT